MLTRWAWCKSLRPRSEAAESNLSSERLPFPNLLTAGPQQDVIDDSVHKKFLEIGKLIEERCREFAVEGEVTAYHPGPVVTTFEFKPSAGVKYAKVVNLGDDLALEVHTHRIRMLGALRASKQCVQCHQVPRGELLGAFSYELVRAEETDRAQRRAE